MAIYSWGGQAPVDRVEVAHRSKEALIFAASGAKRDDFTALSDMLRSQGMIVVDDTVDNQAVLLVTGFKSELNIPDALEQNGFAPAVARETVESEKPKFSFKEYVNKNSLTIAGAAYGVGDIFGALAGFMRKDMNEVAEAAGYSVASIGAMRGKSDTDRAFERIFKDMLKEFRREGIEPADIRHMSTKDLEKPRGIIHIIDRVVSQYPSETLGAFNAFAGTQKMMAGKTQQNLSKQIAGACIVLGMGTAALVPEKKKEFMGETADDVWQRPPEKEKGVIGKLISPVKSAVDWIQEKPLRFAGRMTLINNLFSAHAAWSERATNPAARSYLNHVEAGTAGSEDGKRQAAILEKKMTTKDFADLKALNAEGRAEKRTQLNDANRLCGAWALNMASAAIYLVANVALSLASKGGDPHGGKSASDPSVKLATAAAAILAAQPEAERDGLIDRMSAYLAEQRGVTMEPAEIAATIHEKIENAKNRTWADGVEQSSAIPEPSKPEPRKPAGNFSRVEVLTQERSQQRASATVRA